MPPVARPLFVPRRIENRRAGEMLKKLVVVAGGAALLLGLFFGRDAASYVSTGWRQMRGAVTESVPVSFQINRARDLIKALDGDIKKNSVVIAREEVEIDRLQREVDRNVKSLAESKEKILRLTKDLERGDSSYDYGHRTYTVKQVKADLEHRFSRYQTSEATVNKLQQILEARQRGLLATREKLQAMESQKRQLEVEVANLEARQKMVEVAHAASNINFDDSRLSRTKELIADIQARIEVDEKMVGADVIVQGEIPLDDETQADADITQKVTEYFSNSKPAESETLVKAGE
jgi:chromosome segregation ATPase